MLEEEIVIIRKSHASEYDLVHIRTEGNVGHHLVVRLVRVCEERNLLS